MEILFWNIFSKGPLRETFSSGTFQKPLHFLVSIVDCLLWYSSDDQQGNILYNMVWKLMRLIQWSSIAKKLAITRTFPWSILFTHLMEKFLLPKVHMWTAHVDVWWQRQGLPLRFSSCYCDVEVLMRNMCGRLFSLPQLILSRFERNLFVAEEKLLGLVPITR